MSDENIKNHIVPGEWDWNRSSSYNVGGQTAAQWFPNAKNVDLVAGKTPEEVAQKIAENIIKNTYRTLMTRGMKGCYVYCTDSKLNNYFLNYFKRK